MIALSPVRTLPTLRDAVRAPRLEGGTVALVPTMGALHEGHLSLVRIAKARCDVVVTSLFVNPKQFGPNEDFAAYPRDETRDAELLAEAGCDLLYAPSIETIYPAGFATAVQVAGLTECLEGALRPGHFTGVTTVVSKLLIQVAPDVAIFGEKDFQQLQVIRRMTQDLDLGVEIVGGPIIRDRDGLALSSRNAYLTGAERAIAPALHRALIHAAAQITRGEPIAAAEDDARKGLLAAGFAEVDYFEARDPCNLARLGPGPLSSEARLLCAARLGRTRLLDNVAVRPT